MCDSGRLRQEALEENVADDVETGLAALSQGQTRQPWPHHSKETQHDEVSASQALPRRPEAVNDVPMDQWTPEEIEDHLQFMADFATRLEGTGEYVDGQALSPEGTFVRYDGEGRPPVTDGPFAETKDLIAGPGILPELGQVWFEARWQGRLAGPRHIQPSPVSELRLLRSLP
jgi:hypothetical protein